MEDKIKQLSDIKKMLDNGLINEAEFNSLKKEILGDIQSNDLSSSKNSSPPIAPIQNEYAKGLTDSNKETFGTEQNKNVKPTDKKNITKGKYKYLFISLAILGLGVLGYSIYLVSQKNLEADESLSQTKPIANSSAIITPPSPSQPFVDTFKRPFVDSGKRLIAEQNSYNEKINSLKEITIGTQTWTTRNLDVSLFRNGDLIPHVTSNEEWKRAGEDAQPAWCYYDNDSSNGMKYGKLYNWYAFADSRGIAPIGWHVPSKSEWGQLDDYLGKGVDLGKGVSTKLKSATGWKNNGNGSNASNFSAIPGGYRDEHYNIFRDIGLTTGWWSTSQTDKANAYHFYLGEDPYLYWLPCNKNNGMSVRCIKD